MYNFIKVSTLHHINLLYNNNYTFTAPYAGSYTMECWGAQGSKLSGTNSSHTSVTTSLVGGKGGYTKGTINLSASKSLYIYVGSSSRNGSTNYSFNGGAYESNGCGTKCGGGATDIRVKNGSWDNFTSLKSRIMVAAGGGSVGDRGEGFGGGNGGYGGGLTGQRGQIDSRTRTNANWYQWFGPAGGQTGADGAVTWASVSGTKPGWGADVNLMIGSFGKGASAQDGEGGGGWYGGGGSGHAGGAGGSSYISGHSGCRAIKQSATVSTGGTSYHESGSVATIDNVSYTFTSTSMIAGNGTQAKPGGGMETGHSGNGYARITLNRW